MALGVALLCARAQRHTGHLLLRTLRPYLFEPLEQARASGTGATRAPGQRHYERGFAKRVSFPLAQTGEGISECELVGWAVKEGDVVAQFDKLCDVQSDKASIEITSRYAGRVMALHHDPGAVVKVGAALLELEVADDEAVAPEHLVGAQAAAGGGGAGAGAGGQSAAAAVAAEGALPAAASPAAVAVVTAAAVAADSAATAARAATVAAAAVARPAVAATAAAPAAATAALSAPSEASAAPAQHGAQQQQAVHASPAVRTLARELGVDLATVAGSGPGGRVTRGDVMRRGGAGPQAAAHSPGAAGGAAGAQHPAPHQAPAHAHHNHHHRSVAEAAALYQKLCAAPTAAAAAGGGGAAEAAAVSQVVPLKGYRRAMVKSMTAAAALPQFHLCDEVVLEPLLAVRAALKEDRALREQGVRLTLLPFVIKALSAALHRHPHVNASLSPGGGELHVHPHHNIGVAMATPSGLVVPNIKQVQRLSVSQVALQLALLQQLAAAGRLPAEALSGGTISVSNIGTLCGTYATPLVTPPEVAIVALGRAQLLPRYPPSTPAASAPAHAHPAHPLLPPPAPVPTTVMPVSWGADHRVLDGAALAAFSSTWKGYLEQPERLLLELA